MRPQDFLASVLMGLAGGILGFQCGMRVSVIYYRSRPLRGRIVWAIAGLLIVTALVLVVT